MPPSDRRVLDWQDGQPRSRRFGDIYFSRDGGLEEARHVFLLGNDLLQRFAALRAGEHFVVGELGFGTGLNFLCTWQAFERTAPAGAQLHFVSCEIDPLSLEELRQALSPWSELSSCSTALLKQYRGLAPGWHRFAFLGSRVHLTLLIGDARLCLPRLSARVDAWFLDGFSPVRNPQMWETELFRIAASLSAPGATVASYSVAGGVRRALNAAGFEVWKSAGYGSKRHMLKGHLGQGQSRGEARGRSTRASSERSVTVIGAGMAGCAAAASLARRGWNVCLVERHDRVAAEASGHAQGMLYARLNGAPTALGELVAAGYQYSLRLLRQLLVCDGMNWADVPLLQLAMDAREARRQEAVARLQWPPDLVRMVDRAQASEIAGVNVAHGGLLFEGGGWVHPPALCTALSTMPGIDLLLGCEVDNLCRSEAGWRVMARSRVVAESAVIVLATSAQAPCFPAAAHLPLHSNRGQITLLPATAASSRLRAVVCGEGYVAPARAGLHTCGATFARQASAEVRVADNVENLTMLDGLSPALRTAFDIDARDAGSLEGRAALRCVSADYLPVTGLVADSQGQVTPGLYTSLAHGSRGLVTAPLSGEILAAWLDDEPAPLPLELMRAISPLRLRAPQPDWQENVASARQPGAPGEREQ